jgi:hypothetical protein
MNFFNEVGVWIGPTERIEEETPNLVLRARVDIADTPRGWMYSIHFHGYGRGVAEPPFDSRRDALNAALAEIRVYALRQIDYAQSFIDLGHNRKSELASYRKSLRWIDALIAQQQPGQLSLLEESA